MHGGGHLFEKDMLFNVADDPHELENLAEAMPETVAAGKKIIENWEKENLAKTGDTDTLLTVLKEGGPLHFRGELENYVKRLEITDRKEGAEKLKKLYNLNFK